MHACLILALITASAGFQAELDRQSTAQDIPGISAVVTRGANELYAGATGYADMETARPMDADTPVYAGSLSKILTAVLTLVLADEGDLMLSETVAGIGNGQESARITIRQLLTHSSGLVREGSTNYWFTADFPSRDALAALLTNTELQTRPGAETTYSNVGYAALGLVIEDATGDTYANALHTRVLEPLRMLATGAQEPPVDIARGYTPVGRIIPSEQRPFAGVGKPVGNRRIREYHDARAMTPAFGVYSSARDLSRLAQFVLGFSDVDLLPDESRIEMLTRQSSDRSIGLRIARLNGRMVARHDGWFAAHRSHMLLDLQSNTAVVVMANSDDAAPDEIAVALLEIALGPGP